MTADFNNTGFGDSYFNNKVALVTGGGSGIGRAAALAYAACSAKVVVSDINAEAGQETIQLIKQGGGEAVFVQTDVSQAEQVAAMVDTAVSTFGKLDISFNNAGIPAAPGLLADACEEEWDRIIGINLKGVWLCMKYAIPQLLKQQRAAIVNMSSAAGLVGIASTSMYSATKFGIIGLTKTAALDYAQTGLRVNAVCPGFTLTPAVEAHQEVVAGMSQTIPMGRLAQVEEVANTVLWLSSDQASYVNGQAIAVDGAYTAA